VSRDQTTLLRIVDSKTHLRNSEVPIDVAVRDGTPKEKIAPPEVEAEVLGP